MLICSFFLNYHFSNKWIFRKKNTLTQYLSLNLNACVFFPSLACLTLLWNYNWNMIQPHISYASWILYAFFSHNIFSCFKIHIWKKKLSSAHPVFVNLTNLIIWVICCDQRLYLENDYNQASEIRFSFW